MGSSGYTPYTVLLCTLIGLCALHQCYGIGVETNLTAQLIVNASKVSASPIPQNLFGVFFEEINHAGAGGLWAELVSNRGFEAGGQNIPSNIDPWSTIGDDSSLVVSTDRSSCFDRNRIALHMEVLCDSKGPTICPTGGVGIYNPGFWGMNIEQGKSYKLVLHVRSLNSINVSASLTDSTGSQTLASANILASDVSNWTKVVVLLEAEATNHNSRLQLTTTQKGVIWFDQVSLMPLDTYKGHGFRNDLFKMVADMKPGFIRFPGGCFVEGEWLRNAFRWKETIGPWEERPGHFGDVWNYWTDDGLGHFEFFQLAEDIGAVPIWVFNNGISHQDEVETSNILPFIQEILDGLEFARGDANSTWGSVRALMGHPDPFDLRYVAIGNEDCGKKYYRGNYLKFYNAIKLSYPDIKLISNCDGSSKKLDHPADMYDYHIYSDASNVFSRANAFDRSPRSGPKAFVSEYAVTGKDAGQGSLLASLAEAGFLIGLEKNSYAPLFVNVNDRRWNPDAIVFNSAQVYGTPSYWMQHFFKESNGATLLYSSLLADSSASLIASAHKYTFFPNQFRNLHQKPNLYSSFPPINLYRPTGVWKNSQRFNLYQIRAKTEQETESNTEQNDTKNTENNGVTTSSSGSSRKEEKKRGGWWGNSGKWEWKPIIQAQEVGMFLLQLGILIFVMRVFRLKIRLPGSDPRPQTTLISVPYSDFLSKVNGNEVKKVEVDGEHIMFKLKDVVGVGSDVMGSGGIVQDSELLRNVVPTKIVVYTTTRPSDIKAPYEKMVECGVEFGSPDKRSGGFLNSALITLFYVVVLAGLFQWFPFKLSQHTAGQLRNRKSGSSSRAKETEQGESITFADVAGVDEAKEELEEIVEFLRNPDRYLRVGARPPRGVLLVGLPGTGKTLLAKAVAGEADVPFISCSASEFVELYVGMGASRVRDLFARAKKVAPSIIFIDEIDAVAKSRDGKFRIVSNDEREQTLNQLLTEMDGFDSNSAVIVLGATNRSDVLDPALRRPGRFDRVVMVETPDRTGREAILNVHVSKKELPLGGNVDLGDIASMTTGFTGADLANLVNEAALLAGRQSKAVVEKIDFIHAVERSIAGIEKKTAKLQGFEKGVVARHEAGHAVVGTAIANLIPGQPRVSKLSILPRSGGALGFTYTPPTTEDRYLLFVDELRGRLVTLLGGRAAEEVVYSGRVSTGALDDIRRATDMAYKAITEYGLNQTIGPVSLSTLSSGGIDESSGASPWGRDQGHLDDLAQREVKALLQSALEVALCVVRANPTVLEGLGAHLEEKEKVEGEELHKWLKMVVAPAELAFFITGKQESVLPLQTSPGQRLFDVQ